MHRTFYLFLQITALLFTSICFNAAGQKTDTTSVQGKNQQSEEVTAQLKAKAASDRIRLDSIKKHRDSTQVHFFYSDFEKLGTLNIHQNDTALTGFQTYDMLY